MVHPLRPRHLLGQALCSWLPGAPRLRWHARLAERAATEKGTSLLGSASAGAREGRLEPGLLRGRS